MAANLNRYEAKRYLGDWLTRPIARLERRFGAPLFERLARVRGLRDPIRETGHRARLSPPQRAARPCLPPNASGA